MPRPSSAASSSRIICNVRPVKGRYCVSHRSGRNEIPIVNFQLLTNATEENFEALCASKFSTTLDGRGAERASRPTDHLRLILAVRSASLALCLRSSSAARALTRAMSTARRSGS